ncbi:MAG: UbiA family prenyltransferase [Candidatus Diapherotrites archaeon]
MEKFFSQVAKENFILNLLLLGRPWNGLIIGLFSIIGFLYFSPFNLNLILSLFFVFFLQYFGGTILNDLADYSADKINMPYRPLEKGLVTKKQALILAIISYSSSFLIAFFTSQYLFVSSLVFFFFSIIYSVKPFRLVSRGFFGNFTLGLVTVFIPSISGAIIGLSSLLVPEWFLISFFAFSLVFSFLSIAKDFKDIKGDQESNKLTFTIKHGVKKSILVMLFGALIFSVIFIYYNLKLGVFFIFSSFVFLALVVYFSIGLMNVGINTNTQRYDGFFTNLRVLIFFYSLVILIVSYLKFIQ